MFCYTFCQSLLNVSSQNLKCFSLIDGYGHDDEFNYFPCEKSLKCDTLTGQ